MGGRYPLMRRVACVLCLLLALAVLTGSAPAPAPEEEQGQAVAFPMDAAPDAPVDADAVIVIDRDSGQTLYERDADERAYPASTTKIMTALCVVNAVPDLDGSEVVVQQRILDQLPDETISLAGLEDGEQLSVRQLLYCLLLPSGNDAAVVLADYISGAPAAFSDLMNSTAAGLGCENTHFDSPNGLSGADHYTTARDMARIAEALLQNEDLAEIVRTPFYELNTNRHSKLVLENTNHMLNKEDEYYDPAVTGVKTGSSTAAGRCIIASAEKDGMRLLCVIMGAPYVDDRGQTIEPNPAIVEAHDMYQWAFSTFTKVTLSDGTTEVRVPVKGIGGASARPAWPLTAVLPADMADDITHTVTAQEQLKAPLQAGQTVGQIEYACGGTQLGAVPLVLDKAVSSMYWWMWPLPVAIAAAVLSLLARRALRRRKQAAAAAAASGGRRREDDDYSPFVDYGDKK